jgi:hypothetical protein
MIILLSVFSFSGLWHRNRITLDAPSYYTYLPAAIIHHDLQLNFIDKDPGFYKDKIWYYTIEDNRKLIKHPLGLSLALSPFFLAGHLWAKISGAAETGYSMPYQNAVSIGVLFWLFLGLYYLRKLLLRSFSEAVTSITLLGLVLGTNLLWYSTFEGLMPHAVSFSLICTSLYFFRKWLDGKESRSLIIFSVVFALIVLVRPLAVTLVIYYFMYAVLSKSGLKNFVSFLKPQLRALLVSLISFFLIVSLQFLYWKLATGHWIYDVYIDEHFVFDSPQMIPFLFSFRKGLFVYTPLMLFAMIGLIILFKRDKAVFWSTFTIFLFSVFLLSSWWAWSYGICWGMRPMIDYYSILSIPMATAFAFLLNRSRLQKLFSFIFAFLLIALNLFQTWQYKNGLIHYDDMTKESYFYGFFQTRSSPEWFDLLKPYDWERRVSGWPQVEYSQELIDGLGTEDTVFLRGSNLNYVSVNPRAQNVIAAYSRANGPNEMFFFEHLGGDTVCLRSANGKLLSVRDEYENAVTASAVFPGNNEKFILNYLEEGDNKISLRSIDHEYLSLADEFPHVVKANGHLKGKLNRNAIFRFFVKMNRK